MIQPSRVLLFIGIFTISAAGQNADEGRRHFESRCSACHGANGKGGELGPPIVERLAARSDGELSAVVRSGIPNRGMPAFEFSDEQLRDLVAFLGTLRPPATLVLPRKRVRLVDGSTLEGAVLNQTSRDLQLRTDDHRIHLLRKSGERFRPVTSQVDWPTYNGQVGGNRFSTIQQITKNNVGTLAPKWIFTLNDAPQVETTPVVVEGVMYVTSANECYALDAGSGREIWHFRRPRTERLAGNAAGGMNRGVAVAGGRVFMVTDNAHLLALDRATGTVVWETEMADWHQNYNATSAPLVVGNLVVSGTAGGEQGVRGFIGAWDQNTGKEAWRFWTVPAPGEPGSETWKGKGIEHPSTAAWFTGTYDAALDTVYWPTGNPGPDYNGDDRQGDNLYSCSVVALDGKTGKLKWYYQFTPHDIWDWDATEPPVLVDSNWHGQPRKLLVQANRNGFFYVLDRVDGKLLLAQPFVKKVTWASSIGSDGRPVLNPIEKQPDGSIKTCPAVEGAANWVSTSFHPATGFYYVQSLEKCNFYVKEPAAWGLGKDYMGGTTRPVPNDDPRKVLRAIDIQTGKIAWELPQVGEAVTWGGVLSTSTGLVFFGEDTGMLMAVDAATGKPLWDFQTSQFWKASPMTYVFDGNQYVAVAAGQSIIAFGLTR